MTSSPTGHERSNDRQAAASGDAARRRPPWLIVVLPTLFVLSVYAWFVSIGSWRTWPSGTTYYDQLATAFQGGHPWLDAVPDPKLLALPDPYELAQRQDIPHLSDASLYEGRYFLYFGPFPAVLVLMARWLGSGEIRDIQLAFAFTCGLFIVLELFVLHMWKKFFRHVPAWSVGIMMAAIGFMSPFPWSLGNRAWVHSAAIAAGAFFFVLGLLIGLGLSEPCRHPGWRAILAGTCWGCALASRMVTIVPTLFVVALITVAVGNPKTLSWPDRKTRQKLAGLILPILLTLGVLALYNYVRFGSIFESGVRYALAFLNMHREGMQLFSPGHVIQNLYNYLLMPPKLRYNFPYVWMQMGIRTPILPALQLPDSYFAEPLTGFLISTPFVFLGAIPLVLRLRGGDAKEAEYPNAGHLAWVEGALEGSFLCSFAVFLGYFWASERFLIDFTPSLLLLAVIGMWRLDHELRYQRLARIAASVVGATLACVSVLTSILLALGLNAAAFRLLDPMLWQRLNNVFRP